MRNRLIFLLALFMGFSAASYAQATATQDVTTTLTEVRSLTLGGGAITIPIKSTADGQTPYVNSDASLIVEHDLLINQKVVAFATLTGAVGNWVNRNLWVGATDAGANPYWTAYGAIATYTLVVNGVAQAPGTFINNLPITPVGGTGPLTLHYAGGAGPTAITGAASANVTYNITDQ
jgi:hypothetical protein